MNIEFKEVAACFADDDQWFYYDRKYLTNTRNRLRKYINLVNFKDFQLNNIKQGDYISASELDTEQKYNDAVEVFELFGFRQQASFETLKLFDLFYITKNNRVGACKNGHKMSFTPRIISFNQLMAIGKLKRMMNERDNAALNSSEETELKSRAITEPTKTASDYLNECISVQKERGEQCDSSGAGERSFDAAARAFNALTGGNLKGSDVCLLLTCVKAVRQYSNPERLHDDSMLDGVSYLSLWAEELNKELK